MTERVIEDIFANLEERQKKKRSAVNSSRKGKRGERKICDVLSERFSLPFSRVPDSGAFGTTHKLSNNVSKALSSDIIAPDNFAWTIEVKTGYDIDLINVFMPEDKPSRDRRLLGEFLDQGSRDGSRVGLPPMILYSKDRRPTLAFVPRIGHPKEAILAERLPEFRVRLYLHHESSDPRWTEWVAVSLEEMLGTLPNEFFFE